MRFQDSYSTWNTLRKEVNTAGSQTDSSSDDELIDFNLEVGDSEDFLTALLIKNLTLDPTHPFTSEVMEPCGSFKETECVVAAGDPTTTTCVVTKVLFLALSKVLHCRCLHRNLLVSCTMHRKATCGVILKLIQKKEKMQQQATK